MKDFQKFLGKILDLCKMPMTSLSLPRYNESMNLWERELFDHDEQTTTMLYATTLEGLKEKSKLIIIENLNIAKDMLDSWPSLKP